MSTLSDQETLSNLKSKREDALAKRDFWAEKADKYRIAIEVLSEEQIPNGSISYPSHEISSYLHLSRDKRAYKRLEMFKEYVEKNGGKAPQERFRGSLQTMGDTITASAWRTFLANNAEKFGLYSWGDGYYSTQKPNNIL